MDELATWSQRWNPRWILTAAVLLSDALPCQVQISPPSQFGPNSELSAGASLSVINELTAATFI